MSLSRYITSFYLQLAHECFFLKTIGSCFNFFIYLFTFLGIFLSFCASNKVYCGDSKCSGEAHQRHMQFIRYHEQEFTSEEVASTNSYNTFNRWDNWRHRLANKGITITASYVTDILGNPIGGKTRGFAYAGSMGADALFDFEKIYGCRGLEGYISFVWRTGTNLAKKIGNQFPPAQLYGGETWRLDLLYLKQEFFCNRLNIKAGRLQAGDDFLQNPLYYHYVSNAFDGNPIGVFFNVAFTAYPNATWGAYVDYKPSSKILTKFALYNANAHVNKNSYNGFNFQFKNTDGLQWITEWSYIHNQGLCDSGLPGNYKFGAFYYTAPFANFLGGKTRGNFGYYFLFDQMIYREGGPGSDQGLTPFVALLFAPENRNTFPFFFTSGLVYKGLIPGRCQDVTAFGVAYGTYSRDLRAAERESKRLGVVGPHGDQSQNFEMVLELNHMIYVNKWFYVQPDIQYIINPKGYGNIENALVIGAQVGLTF